MFILVSDWSMDLVTRYPIILLTRPIIKLCRKEDNDMKLQ